MNEYGVYVLIGALCVYFGSTRDMYVSTIPNNEWTGNLTPYSLMLCVFASLFDIGTRSRQDVPIQFMFYLLPSLIQAELLGCTLELTHFKFWQQSVFMGNGDSRPRFVATALTFMKPRLVHQMLVYITLFIHLCFFIIEFFLLNPIDTMFHGLYYASKVTNLLMWLVAVIMLTGVIHFDGWVLRPEIIREFPNLVSMRDKLVAFAIVDFGFVMAELMLAAVSPNRWHYQIMVLAYCTTPLWIFQVSEYARSVYLSYTSLMGSGGGGEYSHRMYLRMAAIRMFKILFIRGPHITLMSISKHDILSGSGANSRFALKRNNHDLDPANRHYDKTTVINLD